jgi:hypothetical protein
MKIEKIINNQLRESICRRIRKQCNANASISVMSQCGSLAYCHVSGWPMAKCQCITISVKLSSVASNLSYSVNEKMAVSALWLNVIYSKLSILEKQLYVSMKLYSQKCLIMKTLNGREMKMYNVSMAEKMARNVSKISEMKRES